MSPTACWCMRNGRVAATLDGDRISEESILGAAMLEGEAA